MQLLPAHRKNLLDLLQKALSASEFDEMLSIYFADFQQKYLHGDLNQARRSLLLFQHCTARDNEHLPALFEALQSYNPTKYEQLRPYFVGDEGSSAPAKPAASGKKKILFISANPKATAQLDLDKEFRTTQEELRSGSRRDDYQCLLPLLAATTREIMHALEQRPQIVHFSGHGGGDALYVLDREGFAKAISTPMLEEIFGELKGVCECILLNACYSAQQAQALSRLGFTVIGYNLPVGDASAIYFTQGFYLGLGNGNDYLSAARKGKIMLMDEGAGAEVLLEIWKDGEKISQ
jgi:hypothetical protein